MDSLLNFFEDVADEHDSTSSEQPPAKKQRKGENTAHDHKTSTAKKGGRPKKLSYDVAVADEHDSTSSEQPPAKKPRNVKTLNKKQRTKIVDSLNSIEMCLMSNIVEARLLEYVQQGEQISKEVVQALLCKDYTEQRESIIEHHRTVFASLYQKCGHGKDKYLLFQVEWYKHCSALLLPLDMGLEAVQLDESPLNKAVEHARNEWHQFCESISIDHHSCNKVMVIFSSILYNFFLEHVRSELKSKEQPISASNIDGDDVYYRFGGAVISDMVKLRYKNIKQCLATKVDTLSQEITVLMSINTTNKCSMPDYLQYRDEGYMYTPKPCFVPFFRKVDTCVKTVINHDSLKQNGDKIIKVCSCINEMN